VSRVRLQARCVWQSNNHVVAPLEIPL